MSRLMILALLSWTAAVLAQTSAPTSTSLPSAQPTSKSSYGVPWEADSLGNLQIGKTVGRMVSYRFRAEQSAKIDHLVVYLVYRARATSAATAVNVRLRKAGSPGELSVTLANALLGYKQWHTALDILVHFVRRSDNIAGQLRQSPVVVEAERLVAAAARRTNRPPDRASRPDRPPGAARESARSAIPQIERLDGPEDPQPPLPPRGHPHAAAVLKDLAPSSLLGAIDARGHQRRPAEDHQRARGGAMRGRRPPIAGGRPPATA